jgi:hypothetical protein
MMLRPSANQVDQAASQNHFELALTHCVLCLIGVARGRIIDLHFRATLEVAPNVCDD